MGEVLLAGDAEVKLNGLLTQSQRAKNCCPKASVVDFGIIFFACP